jgi:YVTN family beta-propeller protein
MAPCTTLLAAAAIAVAAASPARAAGATLVVLNKAEATVSLVSLSTGEPVATLPTGGGPHEAAASPDGRTVLATNYGTREAPGGTLTVLDVPGVRVVRTIELGPGRRPHGVAFLDDRRALVTAEGTKSLLVVDVAAGEVTRVIETGQDVSHMVAAAADGRRAYVANVRSGTVTAIDLEAGKVLAQIATGRGAEGIAIAPGGREVWVTNREADTVSVIDPSKFGVVAELRAARFPIRVAFTPDGRRALVSCARSGDVAVFDVAARREVRRLNAGLSPKPGAANLLGFAGGVPVGIVVDPAGARAYVAHTNADAVAVFDLATGTLVKTLHAGREPDGMALALPVSPGR